ncbi:MAG: HYR domain-containing protein [Saprospiraceae bacterium]
MKKHFLICLPSLLCILLVLLFSTEINAQCEGAPNPPFPGCQAPGGKPFKVLLVLDESGSVNIPVVFEPQFEQAVTDFADALEGAFPTTGRMQMGIVEFSDVANIGMAMKDVADPDFEDMVAKYLDGENRTPVINPNYSPARGTDYVKAWTKAKEVVDANDIDLIFFISDGNPDPPQDINSYRNIANAVKASGTYVFGIALGSGINDCHIRAVSGPDVFVNGNLPPADWVKSNFSDLPASLVMLANSLIDNQAPKLTCSPPIKVPNDPGKCSAVVIYNIEASDNCPPVTVNCTPASGSVFNVGQTNVTCTAKDNVGNVASCSFKITVLDLEAPKITCPADKTISCEESLAPANTGSPVVSDNCAIGGTGNVDVRVDGSCLNEFTVNRTWTTSDIHGNSKSCLQIISVQDKKLPVIKCPPNVTVECDTSVAKTGKAVATDNCDTDVSIVWSNIHISGDCDWFCITERHWKATDNCGNTSGCVQVITKDVTPLIEKALEAGPLVWGQTAATVTLQAGQGSCVVQWLPYVGVVPTALKFDDAIARAPGCTLMSNPMSGGHIVNPLLGEAMKLKILVRLNPALGTTKLSAIPCPMHFIVRQALGGGENATVNELLRVTDLTLGNINVNLLVPEHTQHLLDVLKCVNAGRTVCKP